MLFNSYSFLLAFLPVVLAGAWALRRSSGITAVQVWLAMASLAFYGLASPAHLPLLLGSVLFNHFVGERILAAIDPSRRHRWLVTGIAANLAVLGIFKYASFAAGSLNEVFPTSVPDPGLVLPVGISFFTFTQIAFLVDAARHQASPYGITNYTLFVSYFPHLVAGPILHHRETVKQFDTERFCAFRADDVLQGSVLFAIGLAKKVLLADMLAPFADATFLAADQGIKLSFWEAWFGLAAYSLQLYFDFSGYSDMAVGLSLLLGVRIPINFRSPYRATSIIDFWHRWHISLSTFLRDYLYVPLGGNRRGPLRRYTNLMITMLLGGLWHGAGWGFLIWGGLHGFYLLVNHGWRQIRGTDASVPSAAWVRLLNWSLTLLAVMLAWSFFRASTLDGAFNLIIGALGRHGVGLPQSLGSLSAALSSRLPGIEWLPIGMFPSDLVENKLAWVFWVVAAGSIALLTPNSTSLVGLDEIAPGAPRLPSAWIVGCTGVFFALALLSLHRQSPFLYFQF